MSHFDAAPKRNQIVAVAARSLTLARVAAVVPFLWLLVDVANGGSLAARSALALLYGFVALSDFMDGRLARRAGAASAFWARADVGADILFNLSSLAVASWIGLVGPWVAAGMALLAGRFLLKINSGAAQKQAELPEDRAGKLAGVLYYGLVGWITAEVASGGLFGRFALARGGDAVFLYTLVAFWAGRARPMSSRRP
jgi:phosphatidylglycerophosphate synthase